MQNRFCGLRAKEERESAALVEGMVSVKAAIIFYSGDARRSAKAARERTVFLAPLDRLVLSGVRLRTHTSRFA